MTAAHLELADSLMSPAGSALLEISRERARQDAKWGEQNHPDGTGGKPAELARDLAQADTDRAAKRHECTWRHILNEEVREAFAETDPTALRTELVQVAAVATQWVEAIDRRQADQ